MLKAAWRMFLSSSNRTTRWEHPCELGVKLPNIDMYTCSADVWNCPWRCLGKSREPTDQNLMTLSLKYPNIDFLIREFYHLHIADMFSQRRWALVNLVHHTMQCHIPKTLKLLFWWSSCKKCYAVELKTKMFLFWRSCCKNSYAVEPKKDFVVLMIMLQKLPTTILESQGNTHSTRKVCESLWINERYFSPFQPPPDPTTKFRWLNLFSLHHGYF